MTEKKKESAKELYERYDTKKATFLNRAYDASELTIPFIFPRGDQKSQNLPTPYQSIGARGVNNLASKLLLLQFPPNQPFHKEVITDFEMLKNEFDANERSEIEKALEEVERAVSSEVDTKGLRVPHFEALRHIITTGNVLYHLDKDNDARVFHLDEYVVRRGPTGKVLEIIVREKIDPQILEEDFGHKVKLTDNEEKEHEVEIYTVIQRKKKKFHVFQEVKGVKVKGTEGKHDIDKLPWFPLRFSRISGESYGRGFVEELIGDLRSLEGLTRSIVQGSAAASKLLILVKPGSFTTIKTISKSESGDVRPGQKEDVSFLTMDKFADFRVARDTILDITKRLEAAFLLGSSIQRDAERVTAKEFSFMARELETTLGGFYSINSQEFQLPFLTRLKENMKRRGVLPDLPEDIKPVIITGLDALGRSSDGEKLEELGSVSNAIYGPEATASVLSPAEFLKRYAVSLGIDQDGLVKTEEDLQAEQQQAQQQNQLMEMVSKLGPQAMKSMGDQQQGQPPTQGEQ